MTPTCGFVRYNRNVPNNIEHAPNDGPPLVARAKFWQRLSQRKVKPPAHGLWDSSIATGRQDRPGSKMPLFSLAPAYQKDQHQVYADLLNRAIKEPSTKSIALTGGYGTGKSSILKVLEPRPWEGLAFWLPKRRIVELSLSTLDRDLVQDTANTNPAERTASNQIQKELVKQLLYKLPTRYTPQSRFPRASKPSGWGALSIIVSTLGFASLAWLLTFLLGWQEPIDQRLSETGWTRPWLWGVVGIVLVVISFSAWKLLAGRYALKAGVKAGSLNFSLEPRSSSYFDQYLDEIVYFFQISKTNIVFIEDVDRFEDAAIFDTLRALNILINSSRQINRRVVFVYAVRDSVLSLVGRQNQEGEKKNNRDPVSHPQFGSIGDRANRAKYFDVIIPVVPFVTAVNARDLMMDAMAPHVSDGTERGISSGLIRLAARHIADMRTLWTIRNEYEVHLDRLITSANPAMPGINEDSVFSLVLLRTTSPETFEKIQSATSSLDILTNRCTELVETNIVELSEKLTELQMNDSHSSRNKDLDRQITNIKKRIEMLRHYTWEQLCTHTEINMSTNIAEKKGKLTGIWKGRIQPGETAANFIGLVDFYAPSDLVRDLIVHGYLTRHFARYSSRFYGKIIEPDAAEYIARAIEPGKPITEHPLTPKHVDQLLMEQGAEHDDADLFDDPSVYNLDIVRHLIEKRPHAALRIAQHLAQRWGNLERSFVQRYFQREENAERLAEMMSPYWQQALCFTVLQAELNPDTRLRLVNAVLKSIIPELDYDLDNEVGAYLAENHPELPALRSPGKERADFLFRTTAAANGNINDLKMISADVVHYALGYDMYPIDANNLEVMREYATESFDTLKLNTKYTAIYGVISNHIDNYLDALLDMTPIGTLVEDPKNFAEVLNVINEMPFWINYLGNNQDFLEKCVVLVGESGLINDLENVPYMIWPFLLEHQNTPLTFRNVQCYIEKWGVDRQLASALNETKKIDVEKGVPDRSRHQIAHKILGAKKTIPDAQTRTDITRSLEPVDISVADFEPEYLDVVGPLLKAGLLADTPETFSAELQENWIDFESAVAASNNFSEFENLENVVPATLLPNLLLSEKISESAKSATLERLVPIVRKLGTTKPTIVDQVKLPIIWQINEPATAIIQAILTRGDQVDGMQVKTLQESGAATAQVIALLAAHIDTLTIEDIREILAALGGNYARVSVGGRGIVGFPVDNSHQLVLGVLKGITHTGALSKTTYKYGTRLEANLKISGQ